MTGDSEPSLQEISKDIKLLAGDVRQIKRHVVGDSDPERSLLYRMHNNEREISEMQAGRKRMMGLVWASFTAVAGAAGLWLWSRLTGTHAGR